MNRPIFFFLALMLLTICLRVDEARAAGCLANGCHAEIRMKKNVHAPVGGEDCLSCHQQKNASHPSGGEDFTATAEGGALCFQCHDKEGFTARYKHGPASSGACLTCHDPHGSDLGGLLKTTLKDLCLGCHRDFAESMEQSAHLHTAIRKLDCNACHMPHSSANGALLKGESTDLCFGCHENIKSKYESSRDKHKALYVRQRCGNCHFAHFSQYPSLLVKEGEDLCFTCHGEDESSRSDALRNIRAEIEGKKVVHEPVAEGECSHCHDPHGSNYAKLLNGAYPQSFYAPYLPDEYDFCFQCHDKELLTAQPVKNQTGFRNGADNLHYRHVAIKQKGRTCQSCHSVHASDGEKLINPEGIPFGKWKIPIRFAATETGGGCVPGCHRSLNYDRNEAVDYSAAKGKDGEKKEVEEKSASQVEAEMKEARQKDKKQKDQGRPGKDVEPLDTEPLGTGQKEK